MYSTRPGKEWWQFWKCGMNKTFGSNTEHLLRLVPDFMNRLKVKSEESLVKLHHMHMAGYQGESAVLRGTQDEIVEIIRRAVQFEEGAGFNAWRTIGDYECLKVQGINAERTSVTCYMYRTSSGFATFGNAISDVGRL